MVSIILFIQKSYNFFNKLSGPLLSSQIRANSNSFALEINSRSINRIFVRTMLRQPVKQGYALISQQPMTSLAPIKRTCTYLVSTNKPGAVKDMPNPKVPFSRITPEQESAIAAKEMDKNATSPAQIHHNTIAYKDGDTYIDLGNVTHSSKVPNRDVVPFPQSLKTALGKKYSHSNVVLSKSHKRMYKDHLLEKAKLTTSGTAEESDLLKAVKFTPPTKPKIPSDEHF